MLNESCRCPGVRGRAHVGEPLAGARGATPQGEENVFRRPRARKAREKVERVSNSQHLRRIIGQRCQPLPVDVRQQHHLRVDHPLKASRVRVTRVECDESEQGLRSVRNEYLAITEEIPLGRRQERCMPSRSRRPG